jgi:hypothetical protein
MKKNLTKKLQFIVLLISFITLSFPLFSQAPIVVYNASSPNVCDGSAVLVDSTIILSSVQWTLNNGTSPQGVMSVSNLCPGTYSVVYTYYVSPTLIDSMFLTFTVGPVTSCSGLTMSIYTVDATNSTLCDGSASIIVTGGTAPYAYLWSNANILQNQSGLCAGSYCCVVTDANGCTVSDCGTITSPSASVDTILLSNGSCGPAGSAGTLINTANDCNLDYSLVSSGSMTSSTSYYPDSIQTVWTVLDSNRNVLATYNVTYILPANVTAGCYDLILTVSCDTSLRRSVGTGVLIMSQNISLSPTSVAQISDEEINVINPISDQIQIRSNSIINGSVAVFDVQGRLILNTEVNNQSNININSSNFGSGVYFVRIQSDNKIISRKVVK